MLEEWRDVPHYAGYQVSTSGRVRSKDRQAIRSASTRCYSFSVTLKGRILSPGKTKSGHLTVSLGRGNTRCVHPLVLEAFFVGPRSKEQIDVLHLNGNPADNRLENLRYGTRSENIRFDYATGARVVDERAKAWLKRGRDKRWAEQRRKRHDSLG
jgi:hypothetical protein